MNSVAMNSALLHGFKRNNVFPCALSLSFLPSVGASLLVHFLAIGFDDAEKNFLDNYSHHQKGGECE